MAKTLAWLHGLPLVPVNHLEGHIYAAWLLDPDEPERPEPEFPLVALVVSGGHTFLVEMRDHLHYRLLGQTVDDAAGEAFDKVGRLLGLPYPGGPAIMAAAAGGDPARPPLPARLAGRHRSTSPSAASRPRRGARSRRRSAPDRGRGRAGRLARCPPTVVAELAWAFQDSVVDVLATKTLRAAAEVGARTHRPGRRRGRQLRAARADRGRRGGAGHPARRAAAGPVHGQRRDDRRGRLPALRGRRARPARDLDARPSLKLAAVP